jgi:hypothetical protein
MLFLFFFKPKNFITKAFLGISLKTGVQILTLLTSGLLVVYMLLDLVITNFDLFAIVKDSILSSLNVLSGGFLFLSTFGLNTPNARRGYLVLSLSFMLHIAVLFVHSCLLPFGYRVFNNLGLVFFTLLTVYELYYLWIVYGYTLQLVKGNDALVDGYNFNRYVENFGSAENSFRSSVHSQKV